MAKKDQKFVRPDGEIRRSQLLTTYGPGALIDLVDHAVLVSGLDNWRYSQNKYEAINDEPRLRDAIAERLQQVNANLAMSDAFRKPPEGKDDDPTEHCGIPVFIFPRWFVCQDCRALIRNDGLKLSNKRYVHEGCPHKKRGGECVPVRFVAACRRGHLQEFPWKQYVHHGQPKEAGLCPGTSLKLLEGPSGDLSEIYVKCEACGARERVAKALIKKGGPLPRCGVIVLGWEQKRVTWTARNNFGFWFEQAAMAISR